MAQIPNKILRIRDAVFILPEGFNGDLRDAITEFLKYHTELDTTEHPPHYVDPQGLHSAFDNVVNDSNSRACIDAQILEFIDGEYRIQSKNSPEK